jgi:hypothetical protein
VAWYDQIELAMRWSGFDLSRIRKSALEQLARRSRL